MFSFFPFLSSPPVPPLLGGPMMAAYLAVTRATGTRVPLGAVLFLALAPLGVATQWASRWGFCAGVAAFAVTAGMAWLAPRDSVSLRQRWAALQLFLRNCVRGKNALSSGL